MGALVRLILAPAHWALLLTAALAFAAAAGLARLRGDIPPPKEEEMRARAEVDEDDDWLRQWWQDLGAEDRASLLEAGFGQQQFAPSKPFVPWWVTRQRRAR